MRAKLAGGQLGALCAHLQAHSADTEVQRSIQGLLKLASQHGKEHVEHVCGIALSVGAPTYRFVREYLARHPAPQTTLTQLDPLIRELASYRDVVARIQQQQQQEEHA